MLIADRATLRHTFAGLVKPELEGPGKPCNLVSDGQIADWGTRSPVMVITEAGTEWIQLTTKGQYIPAAHYLAVHVFVLYATTDGSITEAESEDQLAPIQIGLFEVISSHRSHQVGVDWIWKSIIPDGRSTIEPLKLKGLEFRHEVILLRFS